MINVHNAKRFCKEDISKIENYDKAVNDKEITWHCHHRTEIWWNCSKKDLIENECYYNRKACELIFLTPAEHRRLHSMNMSGDTRIKMKEAKKGKNNVMYGRRGKNNPNYGSHRTEESRRKMSEARKIYWAKKRGEI